MVGRYSDLNSATAAMRRRRPKRERTSAGPGPAKPRRDWRWASDWIVATGLALLVAAAYAQVLRFEFVNYDDTVYVPDNPHVRAGFSLEGIGWAFTTFETANWYPLSWLSLMLDCQLFGPRPGGHHAVNAALHAANSILLFIVLRRMTGTRWRSAAVAAIFAAHPLHVESVAWIAERKDVLSTLFFLLTLMAYQRYALRPSFARWVLVFLGMALGLMAKSMLVTLPVVLLLLDLWPLGRKALLEKLPLLALALAIAAVTLAAQASKGATAMLYGRADLPVRLANAAIAYVKYLAMTAWPADLAVYYPYNFHPSAWRAIAAALLILTLTAWALWRLRQGGSHRVPGHPLVGREWSAVAVGWLWYLVTLVPVIGLVQVGSQAIADRYCYIPSIGLFMAFVWGAVELCRSRAKMIETRSASEEGKRFPRLRFGLLCSGPNVSFSTANTILKCLPWPAGMHRIAIAAAGAAVLAALVVATHYQVSCWINSERLFRHALAISGDNPVACENLGDALLHRGKYVEAEAQFRKVLAMDAEHYRQTPPELAQSLAGQGRIDEAVASLQETIHENSEKARAMNDLALFLAPRQRVGEAIGLLQEAIRLAPQEPAGPGDLAWIYATCPDHRFRNGPKSVELARRACELSGGSDARFRQTLADAYLETGDVGRAAEELRAVLRLNPRDLAAAGKLQSILRPGAASK